MPRSAFGLQTFRSPSALLAIAGALPFVGALFRISVREIADVVVAPIALGMGTVRGGCFLEGCCFGSLTTGVLGVRFPARSPAWNEQLRGT